MQEPQPKPELTPELERSLIGSTIARTLLEQRKVFLWGQVDDDSAREVIDRLLYLDAINPGKEITLYINSPGGYVTSGMAIYDCIRALHSPVSTVCMGLAASMGSILLSAGVKGRRFIFPHGRVMIHQPSGGAAGTSSDIEIQMREILKIKEISARILAENTGQPIERILQDFDRDYWMDARESVEYGIVDAVIERFDR
ncbi:MAG: ATP-dependent Clp protease proteolytic subunit [Bacteroidota bacterium]|nr:ATP-dependent Clp protease proteolytic subunit [Candidatus Kapabacteria bacterium]MCS7302716.1 ATP-dependent Clp protease proteolytic subunit [Candidatus Kapabacteria bacterium]MCX7937067.1 ATP-dependent Clp protease proteolytic subunit [Chlorobiota bacterium]MDW8075166.1 ATP-dependent Clp protease proteolytic subunit [Bacteroidota bacterium]MDW8272397.1 ATP-dependent Clp protease proteolytic subunit [Bacteroidota bacterium]